MTSHPAPARRLVRLAAAIAGAGVAAALLPAPPAAGADASDTVLVTRADGGGDRDVVVRDVDTGHERPLVADDGDDHSAVWSPDGSRVAFVRESGGQADVYVVNADGSGLLRLTAHSANERNPAWSVDGAFVAFDSDRISGIRQIFRAAHDDPYSVWQLTVSATDEHYAPTLSPDGLFVTVVRRTPSQPDVHPQIVRVRLADRSATSLTETPADHADPEYAADGTRILFTSDRGNTGDDHDVYVMDADGTDETRLTTTAQPETSPRWSPAAPARILYVHGHPGGRDLRTVGVDGTGEAGYLVGATDDTFGDIQPGRGCSISWDGGGGSASWHTAANWDGDRVPGGGDVVCIPAGPGSVAYSSGTTSIASLTSARGVALTGGTLTLPVARMEDEALLTLSGGALGGGTLFAAGTVAWHAGGTVLGSGTTTVGDAATLQLVTADGDYWVPAGATIANRGTLAAGSAARLHGDGTVRNRGVVVKDSPGSTTRIATALDDDGAIRVADGTLRLPAPVGDELRGAYEVHDGAILAFDAPWLARTSTASLDLRGGAAIVDSTGATVLRELASNSGTLRLRDGATVATTTTLTNTGTIGGSGTIGAPLVNAGTLAPDELTVAGGLTQLATGTLTVEIGAVSHSRIAAAGPAALAGRLDIRQQQPFTPAWNDAFPVITASSATVDLDSVTGAALPGGLALRPRPAAAGIRLVAADVVAPTTPRLTATSHTPSRWSADRTVAVAIDGGSDAHSGVAGYPVAWSTSPTTFPAAAGAAPGATARVTSPALASGKSHYVHVRTRDREGLVSGVVRLGPFWIDATRPSPPSPARPPVHSLRTGTRRSPQIRLGWGAARDSHSGVRSYTVVHRWSSDGRRWRARRSSHSAGTRTVVLRTAAATTSCWSVVANDATGNSAVSRQRCSATPIDSTMLTRTRRRQWSQRTGSAYYRGSAVTTSTSGATLTRRGVAARRVALVATTCRRCGAVRVHLNGRPIGRRIVLRSARLRHRRVIPVATFRGLRRGTVTIRVASTRRPVTIDALGVHLR